MPEASLSERTSTATPVATAPSEAPEDEGSGAIPSPASPEAAAALLALPRERLVETLQLMWRIRAFEEKVEELYSLGRVHGTMHLSIGQEAVPAGWSLVLRDDDYLLSHHRGHGHAMAKGAKADRMMAELLGRQTGYGRGRGGSMHIADVSRGNLGANGIVGGGIPIASGLGLAVLLEKSSKVVLSVFGDGAVNQGGFHEALNLASIWDLPVLFLCENNQYAMSLPVSRGMKVTAAGHAAAYDMPSRRVDGNDVAAVREAVAEAADAIRGGSGPWLVEAVTYRYRGHSKSDRNLYRTREEIADWRSHHDAIVRFAALLAEGGVIDAEGSAAAERLAREEIEAAVAWAETQPEPQCEDVLEGVYAE
jgi:TPP-dependent pyruvate/acetoin dehydrogenase alpha subunit